MTTPTPMPAQNPRIARDQIIQIRATEAEKQMLQQVADKIGAKTVSGAIRKLAKQALKK